MNQRIRQLAEQVGTTTNPDTDFYERDMNKWVDYFSEKFAQLIVQECMKVSNQSLSKYELPSDKIAEHFGVEEHENH